MTAQFSSSQQYVAPFAQCGNCACTTLWHPLQYGVFLRRFTCTMWHVPQYVAPACTTICGTLCTMHNTNYVALRLDTARFYQHQVPANIHSQINTVHFKIDHTRYIHFLHIFPHLSQKMSDQKITSDILQIVESLISADTRCAIILAATVIALCVKFLGSWILISLSLCRKNKCCRQCPTR